MVYTLSRRKALCLKNRPLKQHHENRRTNQHGQPLQPTAAETCICNCSYITVNFWLQHKNLFFHNPQTLRAREKDSRTATPGQLTEHAHLCRCHGSSCCACQGGTSVNMSPQSSIAVGTHIRGGEPVISDTGQWCKPNSKCWMRGIQRSNKPMGQLEDV